MKKLLPSIACALFLAADIAQGQVVVRHRSPAPPRGTHPTPAPRAPQLCLALRLSSLGWQPLRLGPRILRRATPRPCPLGRWPLGSSR